MNVITSFKQSKTAYINNVRSVLIFNLLSANKSLRYIEKRGISLPSFPLLNLPPGFRWLVLFTPVLPCRVLSSRLLSSCLVVAELVASCVCDVLSRLVSACLSCLALSCLVFSCPVLFCWVLSRLVLSSLLLPCIFFRDQASTLCCHS